MFIELRCDHCGEPFRRQAAQFRAGQKKFYCSKDCDRFNQIPADVLRRIQDEALRWTAFHDANAGRWRLSGWERFVQEMCRARFGLYAPDTDVQAAYVDALAREIRAA